jgi:hypothetical protein
MQIYDENGLPVLPISGAGEANTASNVGPALGLGIFFQKTGEDLEFRKLISGDGIISLEIGAEEEIVFTLDPAGISHSALGDLCYDDHPIYVPISASRGFLNPVSGVTPVAGSDLATKAYVDGVGADKTYVHTQVAPSTSWTVPHNLNKYPTVAVTDGSHVVVMATITHNSTTQCTITTVQASTGYAICN